MSTARCCPPTVSRLPVPPGGLADVMEATLDSKLAWYYPTPNTGNPVFGSLLGG